MGLNEDLRADYRDTVVSLQDFVRILPDHSPFTEEQLRMLRTRHAKDFPDSYATETRAVGHLLGKLLEWLDDWARGESTSRRSALVLDTNKVLGWRLEQAVRTTAPTTSHIEAARELLVGVAVARTLPSLSAALDVQNPTLHALGDSLQLAAPQANAPAGLTTAEDFATALVRQCSEVFTDETAHTVIAEVNYAWRIIGHDAVDFANAIDGALSLTSVDVARRQLRVDPALIELMLAAIDVEPGNTVADLTCGECDLLIAVADQAATKGRRAIRLVGRDSDPHAWRIGKARLILRHLEHDLGSRPEKASRQQLRGVRADRVIIDPGNGGHITDAEIANLIDAADQILAPTGRAVLALTASLLWPVEKRDKRLRGLEDKVFALRRLPTAVIVPAGSGETPRHPGDAVWVHDARHAGSDARDRVLTVIAMPPPRPGRSHGGLRDALQAELRQILATDPVAGKGHVSEHEIHHRSLPYADIASRDYDYRPTTWLGVGAITVSDQTRRYAEGLARELSRLVEPASTTNKKRRRGAPETAGDGILAGVTTSDTRQAIRRLVATLASSS